LPVIDTSNFLTVKTILNNLVAGIEKVAGEEIDIYVSPNVATRIKDLQAQMQQMRDEYVQTYDQAMQEVESILENYQLDLGVDASEFFSAIDAVEKAIVSLPDIDYSNFLEIETLLNNLLAGIKQVSSEEIESVISPDAITRIKDLQAQMQKLRDYAEWEPDFDEGEIVDSIDRIHQVWNDLYTSMSESFDETNLTISIEKIKEGIENLDPSVDWSGIFSGLETEFDTTSDSWINILTAMFQAGVPDNVIEAFVTSLSEEIQAHIDSIHIDPPDIDVEKPLKAGDVMDAIDQINAALADMPDMSSLRFSEAFSTDTLNDFDSVITQLSNEDLVKLEERLKEIIIRISELDIDQGIKTGALDELYEKLIRVEEKIEQSWNKQKTEVGGTGKKIEEFLARYKFSLGLIAGALIAIAGITKYSTVFGSMIDLIGSSLGYLADLILLQLLPYVMFLVDWIIELADWFDKLPDPVKTVIAFLVLLGLTLTGLFALSKAKWVQNIIQALTTLATKVAGLIPVFTQAGVLTGAGWIAGILSGLLIGLAVVYALIQTGIMNAIGNIGQKVKEQFPIIAAAMQILFLPVGAIGTIINDLLSGQIDKIPYHLWVISKEAGAAFEYMGAVAEMAFAQIGIAALNALKKVGELAKTNPLTAGLGDSATKFADKYLEGADKQLADLKLKIEAKQGLMEQWGNIARKGVNVSGDAEATPGNILNGLTYDKQVEALIKSNQEQTDKLLKTIEDKEKLLNLDINTENLGLIDLQKVNNLYTEMITAQSELNEARHAGKPAEEIKKLENRLSSARDKVISLSGSMQSLDQVTDNIGKSGEKVAEKVATKAESATEQIIPGETVVERDRRIRREKHDKEWAEHAAGHPEVLEKIAKRSTDTASKPAEPIKPAEPSKPIEPTKPIETIVQNVSAAPVKPVESKEPESSKSDMPDQNFSLQGVLEGLGLTGIMAWLTGVTTNIPVQAVTPSLASSTSMIAPSMMVIDPDLLTGGISENNQTPLGNYIKEGRESQSPLEMLISQLLNTQSSSPAEQIVNNTTNVVTQPAEPTKPPEPTKPAEPTKPVEVIVQNVSQVPEKPAEPVKPSEPTKPGGSATEKIATSPVETLDFTGIESKITGIITTVESSFKTSISTIESTFTTMIGTVETAFQTMISSVQASVSANKTPVIAIPAGYGTTSSAAPVYHITNQNTFTINGVNDPEKIAKEVSKILDRDTKRVKI
jgi:outer membrane biosynthesis protein TonB